MSKSIWSKFIRKMIGGGFLGLLLAVPAWSADPNPAVPGSLNYIEGQAQIGTTLLNSSSIGSVQLEAGQTVSTEHGRIEMLLTPGVFFRLGEESSATMVSPSLTDTEVRLNKGQAMVEVTQIYKQNDIRIDQDNATAQLIKRGLYDFNAAQTVIRVFDGKAIVRNEFGQIDVKASHEVELSEGGTMQSRKFDKISYENNPLFRWSSLRSAYLSKANVETGRTYPWNGWLGGGWYWNPSFDCYTFFPENGILYSPFGYGFYPPWFFYGGPYFYSRPYFYGEPFHHEFERRREHEFHHGFGEEHHRVPFERFHGEFGEPHRGFGEGFHGQGGFHGEPQRGTGEGFHHGGGFNGGSRGGFHGRGGFRGSGHR